MGRQMPGKAARAAGWAVAGPIEPATALTRAYLGALSLSLFLLFLLFLL
jgi:hypothetical protein